MNTNSARRQMVEQQVRTWDVFDADVLSAMGSVARDMFVPAELRNVAYADAEIPLPHHQCMLRPSLVGKLIQALDIKATDDVLEVGTGSGYLTACIAGIAGTVTSIDIYNDFIQSAKEKLADCGIENVTLQQMDATAELPPGRFDAIALTGSVSKLDERFINALKPGGRLFVVTGTAPAMTAMLITAGDDGVATAEELFETNIPPLVLNEEQPVFSF
jgi:protein-L-isoaspartate(D-aspartate) O-methyltransferase